MVDRCLFRGVGHCDLAFCGSRDKMFSGCCLLSLPEQKVRDGNTFSAEAELRGLAKEATTKVAVRGNVIEKTMRQQMVG